MTTKQFNGNSEITIGILVFILILDHFGVIDQAIADVSIRAIVLIYLIMVIVFFTTYHKSKS